MSTPNHLVYCGLEDVELVRPDDPIYVGVRFPVLHLQRNDSGDHASEGLVFVDPMYGCTVWQDRTIGLGDAPPTWMDPIRFLQMVREDAETLKIARQYYARKSAGNMKALIERLQVVLENQYAAYLWEQFERSAVYLAEFVVAAVSSDLMNQPKRLPPPPPPAARPPKPPLPPRPTRT